MEKSSICAFASEIDPDVTKPMNLGFYRFPLRFHKDQIPTVSVYAVESSPKTTSSLLRSFPFIFFPLQHPPQSLCDRLRMPFALSLCFALPDCIQLPE